MYHTILMTVSLASEPELAKNTFEASKGAIDLIFSARLIAGS